jgi:hypothetical protein
MLTGIWMAWSIVENALPTSGDVARLGSTVV